MRFSLVDLFWLVTLAAAAIYGCLAKRELSQMRQARQVAEDDALGWRLLFEKSK